MRGYRDSSTKGATGTNQSTCACGLVPGVPTKARAPVVWCRGSQPKHARLWFGARGPKQSTCVCGLVPGAPTKARAPVFWCQGPRPKHARLWFGAGGPNQATSLTQHYEVRANSSISAMWSPYYPFLEERAMLGVIDTAVAPTKPRLEPSITKFTPHLNFYFFSGGRKKHARSCANTERGSPAVHGHNHSHPHKHARGCAYTHQTQQGG